MNQRAFFGFFPKRALMLTLLAFTLLLAACEEAEIEAWVDMGVEWADSNGFLTEEGLNLVGIGGEIAGETVADVIGGDEEDAALDVWEVVEDVQKADALSAQARAEGGEAGRKKLEEAIELRPDDWNYRIEYLVLAEAESDYNYDCGDDIDESFSCEPELIGTGQGVLATARDQGKEAVAAVDRAVDAGGDCEKLYHNFYSHLEQTYREQSEKAPENEYLANQVEEADQALQKIELGEYPGCEGR